MIELGLAIAGSLIGNGLLVAGVAKLSDSTATDAIIGQLGVGPVRPSLRRAAAVALGLLEIAIAVAAIVAFDQFAVRLLVSATATVFLAVLIGLASRAAVIECGCFGAHGPERRAKVLLRGFLVMALAFVCAFAVPPPGALSASDRWSVYCAVSALSLLVVAERRYRRALTASPKL